jgi:hypothetical protein
MRINELIVESQEIDEVSLAGIGRGIGKAANMAGKAVGGAVGGTVAAAKQFAAGAKQGYKGSNSAVGGTPVAGASAVDVDQIKAQIAQKQKEIKSLQSQITATEPGIGQATNTVGATATNTPAAQTPAQGVAPAAQEPAVEPGIGQQQNTVGATATNTEQPVADPAGRIDPTLDPAQQPAAPAATAPKMTAKDQNALKARLKAKQGTAAKTQTGFNQYVQGGGGSTLAGADAQGNPVFKQNVKRESVEFYSKFLGQML